MSFTKYQILVTYFIYHIFTISNKRLITCNILHLKNISNSTPTSNENTIHVSNGKIQYMYHIEESDVHTRSM